MMKPDGALFRGHNIDRIADRAFEHERTEELYDRLQSALDNPDEIKREDISISQSLSLSPLVKALAYSEDVLGGLSIGERVDVIKQRYTTRIFSPYDTATSEYYPGVEFNTSVVGFDLLGTRTEVREVV